MANDAFRFQRVCPNIRTKTRAQKLVLFALVARANKAGTCHPSYQRLMQDTGLSRGSIYSALRYLRDELKVLDWKQGHSNQYMKPLANLYTLDYKRMATLSEKSAEFNGCTQQEKVLSSTGEVLSSIDEVLSSTGEHAEFNGCTPTAQGTAQDYNCSSTATGPVTKFANNSALPSTEAENKGTPPSVPLSSPDELSKKFQEFLDKYQ